MMRLALIALIVSVSGSLVQVRVTQAQELGVQATNDPGTLVVRPKSKSFERCVDVSIGDETAYGCINERLRNEVDKVAPPIGNVAPLNAKSQDIKLGIANVPAVRQQYGRNFGVSAVPYRPNLIYSAPLGRR